MTDPTPVTPEHSVPATADGSTVPAVPAQRVDASATEPQATVPDKTQAHDPWSRDAQTVAVPVADITAPYPDQAAYPDQAGYPHPTASFETAPAATAPAKRRRTPIILAIVAVLIVLLGAGAYAGVRYYTGGGIAEPEGAMPASVGAFVRIDVNPGLRDKLAFNNLVKKFPTKGRSTEDLVTQAETRISTAAGLNYSTDVKPWFGGQAGIAEWTNASGDPVALLAFSSTNDAKAKVALAKVQAKEGSSFGFVVRGGYVLIAGASTGAQADATAAATEAAAHNLAGSATYKSALSHISGHNLVIAYTDLSKLGALLTKEMGNLGAITSSALGSDGTGLPSSASGALAGITGLTSGASNPFAKLTGTVIVGGSIVSDGIEVHAHAQGLPASGNPGTPSNVRPTLDAMPGSTTVALALAGTDPKSDAGKKLSQTLNGLMGTGGGSSSADALAGPLMSVLTSKVISVSLTGVANDMPTGFIAIDTRDSAAAQSLMTTLNELTSGHAVPGMTVNANGTHVQATFGGAGSGGKLGANSLYTETMAGMSNESTIGYVDITKVVSLLASNGAPIPATAAAQIAPFKAMGFGASSTGSSTDELVRVVIK